MTVRYWKHSLGLFRDIKVFRGNWKCREQYCFYLFLICSFFKVHLQWPWIYFLWTHTKQTDPQTWNNSTVNFECDLSRCLEQVGYLKNILRAGCILLMAAEDICPLPWRATTVNCKHSKHHVHLQTHGQSQICLTLHAVNILIDFGGTIPSA